MFGLQRFDMVKVTFYDRVYPVLFCITAYYLGLLIALPVLPLYSKLPVVI